MIMGLDQSLTSTGYVILNPQGVIRIKGCIETGAHQFASEIERLLYIKQEIFKLCRDFGVYRVYMEGFSYGARGNVIFQLGGLGYLLRELFYESHISLTIIPPSKVKKFATGKGNADKKAVVAAVNQRWNQSFKLKDNDLADAMTLAYMALQGENNET